MGDGRECQPWERAVLARERDAEVAAVRAATLREWERCRVQHLVSFNKYTRREALKIAKQERRALQMSN